MLGWADLYRLSGPVRLSYEMRLQLCSPYRVTNDAFTSSIGGIISHVGCTEGDCLALNAQLVVTFQ